MLYEELYGYFLNSAGVTTDSRSAGPGHLFFALRGNRFDGHRFIDQAFDSGCSLAVIDNRDYSIPGKTFLVDDVIRSLQQIARHHRKKFNIPVLAITGSNGKTTTKELLNAVLSARFRTLATRGNLNNHIGVPLTLLEMDEYHQFAVIEMGANHAGEIGLLCELAMPSYGIITNIGYAHLEGFGSPDGVLKAKSELFRYLGKNGGTAFLNADHSCLVKAAGEHGIKTIAYGSGENLYLSGTIAEPGEFLTVGAVAEDNEYNMKLITRLPGAYNLENMLAAVCAGIYFGVPPMQIKDAVENYTPGNNRSQISVTSYNKLLLDAYNANPDSMKAAIINFITMPGENKSLILGDMLELGSYAADEHNKIIDLLKRYNCRDVMLVGEHFSGTSSEDDYFRFKKVDELNEWLIRNPVRGRFILLKGSRGIELEKCTGNL